MENITWRGTRHWYRKTDDSPKDSKTVDSLQELQARHCLLSKTLYVQDVSGAGYTPVFRRFIVILLTLLWVVTNYALVYILYCTTNNRQHPTECSCRETSTVRAEALRRSVWERYVAWIGEKKIIKSLVGKLLWRRIFGKTQIIYKKPIQTTLKFSSYVKK